MRPELEIDLYSGRPNPRIALSDAMATWLRTSLSTSPRMSGRGDPGLHETDRLGYRGVRVTGLLPQGMVVAISGGVIVVRHGDEARDRRLDSRRRIESGLLRFAAKHLPEEFQELESYLEELAAQGGG